jgi:hypothetical protein
MLNTKVEVSLKEITGTLLKSKDHRIFRMENIIDKIGIIRKAIRAFHVYNGIGYFGHIEAQSEKLGRVGFIFLILVRIPIA